MDFLKRPLFETCYSAFVHLCGSSESLCLCVLAGASAQTRAELQARVEGGRRQQDWFSRGDRALSAGSCFPFLSSLPVPRGPGASAAPERFLQPGIPRRPGIIGRAAAIPASSAATLTPCGGLGHRACLEICYW